VTTPLSVHPFPPFLARLSSVRMRSPALPPLRS
jgi:hypothetical protein